MIDVEKVLEFDKIKENWKAFAYTDGAKKMIDETTICLSEVELLARQRETTEARTMIEKMGNPPMVSLNGISELFTLAFKGGCLQPEQLETVGLSLTAIGRLKSYLHRCKQLPLSLPYYEENLDAMEEIRNEIQAQIRNGKVEDNASRLLKSLRSDILHAETKMREKADSVMRSQKDCMSDSFSTLRNGHICVPVKKECKFKVAGAVIDKSSTGNTLFIEPTAVAKYYEELQMLRIEEENEERRILYALSAMLADKVDLMESNIRTVEKLDYIFSKGKLSMDYKAVEPKITTERHIRIVNGRHPLLDPKTCVPLQFEIGGKIQGIVITGPNTGGKTVAIKTVALLCMMAQCGLHIGCEEAEICMNSSYLCDIGDGQNISENLSTFSSHITNVLEILEMVNKDSLVIMDEMGSGTDPTEGMGIAIAIIRELKKSGALFLATTHYPEVKQFAHKEEGIVNARMTFDRESLRPMYQLIIGEAGESCAFYIAEKLGMPVTMLQNAVTAAYGDQIPESLTILQEEFKKGSNQQRIRKTTSQIKKKKVPVSGQEEAKKYQLGDSVMVYPDKKIGIVCKRADDKGVLRVQLPDKKIWINHKRIKLLVPADQLYPDEYDFSIIFDTVKNRKLRHQMERKHVEGAILLEE